MSFQEVMLFQESVFNAALDYIEKKWAVFPLHSIDEHGGCTCGHPACHDSGKHPRVRRGVKEASIERAKITEWFGPGSQISNIGIATGAVSGITVLDIDIGEGKEGDKTWAALIEQDGEPQTDYSRTGSGGMHFFFKYNSALKTSSNTLGPGIDCRNDAGYVVGPPSRHCTGGVYAWDVNTGNLADLPAHLASRRDNRGRPRKADVTRKRYAIEQVAAMLKCIPADDRDLWRSVGIILGRAFDRSEAAWDVYTKWSEDNWSAAGKKTKSRNHDQIMYEAFNKLSQEPSRGGADLSIGTIVKKAIENGWVPKAGEVAVDNFVYYGPGNSFIYRPTADTGWITEGVNAAVSLQSVDGELIKASDWLRRNVLATSMTNDPILDSDYVKGYDCRDGVLIKQEGAAVYNSYRPSTIELGDSRLAKPFVEHVNKIFAKGDDAKQFLDYMAHRVQRPEEKPRFALMICGEQGVGKDSCVEMVAPAIGPWNVINIDPSAVDSNFNEYVAAVLVRVSETSNLHEMNRWAFNERMKVLIAGTPDYVTVNPKYGEKYSVRMHCGVVLTTNHMVSGIFIPSDDRRYDVIDCATKEEMGIDEDDKRKEYFTKLWDWFLEEDGESHIAAFLSERNIDKFSASGGQRKTDAHKTVVRANMITDHWLLDALEELKTKDDGEDSVGPVAVRTTDVLGIVGRDANGHMKDFNQKIQPALIRAGYRLRHNVARNDGRWYYFDDQNSAGTKRKLTTVYLRSDVKIENMEKILKGLNLKF